MAIHLAAYVAGRAGIEGNPLDVAENLAVDAAFFKFVARTRPRRCIYVSSSAVYPLARQTASWNGEPLREREVDVRYGPFGLPDLTYGWAKLTGEYLAGLVQRQYHVPISVYRPFSVYGPGQSIEYPVSAICRRAVLGADPLTVWGRGTQIRDFVYVDDFIGCVMASYPFLDATRPLNIASGVGVDFLTVASLAAEAVGYVPTIESIPGAPEGVHARVGSCAQMSDWYTLEVALKDGVSRLVGHLDGERLAHAGV